MIVWVLTIIVMLKDEKKGIIVLFKYENTGIIVKG